MAAYPLPTLDQFVNTPAYTPRSPAPQEEDPYEGLTPEQRATADRRVALLMKQDELAQKPRGAVSEVITAAKRGAMVELPRMVGQALESTGKPGDFWYGAGRGLVTGAGRAEPEYAKDITEGAHGANTNALVGGAEMLAPSLAPLAALPVLGAVGVPTAAAAGIAGVAGGALFGASQYQDTYEKGIKAGLSEEAAKSAALKTASIEAIGETAGTWIGGKFFTGAVPRILGKKYTVDTALTELRNPQFLPTLARDFGKTTVVETGTEMGQNYGEAAVEQNAGIDKTDPWTAATSAIGPTLAMSAMLLPFGARGLRSMQNKVKAAVNTVQTDTEATAKDTDAALRTLQPAMEPLVGKEQFDLYRLDRMKDAKWFDEAWKGVGADERARVAREQLQPSDAPLALPAPTTPPPASLTEQAPKFGAPPEENAAAVAAAQQESDARYATREQIAAQRGVDAAAYAFAQQSPGMSFPEFTAAVKAGRAGPLGVGGRTTEQGIKDAYLTYLNNQERNRALTAQGEAAMAPVGGPTEAAQGVLPFGPRPLPSETVGAATARLEAAAKPADTGVKPAQGTAKMLGLPTESQIVPGEAPSSASIERTKQSRLRALQETLPGLPRQVYDRLTSVDRQNLPEALREIWHQRKGEAGPAYNQQIAKLYQQLTGQEISATAVQPEKQNGKAEPVRKEISGSSFQDPLAAEGQGDAQAVLPVRQEGQVTAAGAEVHALALQAQRDAGWDTKWPFIPADLQNADFRKLIADDPTLSADEKKRIFDAGEKLGVVPKNKVETKPAQPATKGKPTITTVTATGEVSEVPRPVGYGEWTNRAPDGTISYDTPAPTGAAPERPHTQSEAELQRRGRETEYRMTHNPLIPPNARRQVDSSMLYSFETNEYDPSRPRSFADNMQWVTDVRKAFNLAQGRNVEGVAVEWKPDELPTAVKEKANAQEALNWLHYNYPEDYEKALEGYDPTQPGEGNSRLAQHDRIKDTDTLMHDTAEKAAEQTQQQYEEAERLRAEQEAQDKAAAGRKAAPVAPEKASDDALQSVADKLPEAEQRVLEGHYGLPLGSEGFLSRLSEDVVTLVNKGAKAVDAAIRSIINKIAAGMLAIGIVFNPTVFDAKHAFAYDLPAAVSSTVTKTTTTDIRAVVPSAAREQMSARAQRVYEAMAPQAMKSGKGFVIADKPLGMIHVFHADGTVITQSAALYGKDAGDVLQGDSLAGGKRITPAGTFTLELIRNAATAEYAGGVVLGLQETRAGGGFIAVHVMWAGDPREHRAERLASPSAADNKISFGCINTSNDTFINQMLPNITELNGGPIFVLPDVVDKTDSMFPVKTETTTTTSTSTAFPGNVTETPTRSDTAGRQESQAAATRRGTARRRAANDPGLEFAQTQLPNYTQSDTLMQSIAKGDLHGVLLSLEQNGPSPWVQDMARLLRQFGLKTKLVLDRNMAYDPRGNRVYGTYTHGNDTVTVFVGGTNAHTVLHETTHGASVGNIKFAKAAEQKAESARTAVEAAAVERLKDLREIIDAVGFTAEDKAQREEEFVAEVFSNEKMQQQMRTMAFDQRSLWQRFKDWVQGIFGGPRPELSMALEAAISRSIPFLGESRFGAEAGMSFNHSATAAMGQTDSTISALSAKFDEMTSKVRSNLPGLWQRAWMKAATTFHLTEMVARSPALQSMLPGMKLYTHADEVGIQIRTQVNSEIENVLKPLNAFLAKMKNRDAVDSKMMEIAGGASRLGIDLSKNYEQNKASFNPNLDPLMRDRVNELHSMFMQQPAIVRQTLQRAVLYNRKHYMQHTANLVKMNTSTYGEQQPALVAEVNRLLDIMNPALSQGTNRNSTFFADVYTSNLSKNIDEALRKIRAAEQGTNSSLAYETELLESVYRKAVASPYVHLGRSGDHFLEFTVAAGEQAWRRMQQALQSSGKVIDHPTASRKVFMRFTSPAERDAALNAINLLGTGVIAPDTTRAGMLTDTEHLRAMNRGSVHTLYKIAHNLATRFAAPEAKQMRDALMEELQNSMGDDSPRQALRQRTESGIPGYDAAFRASFIKRGAGASSLVSNSYNMPMYHDAFNQMQTMVNDLRHPARTTADSAKIQASAQAVLSTFQERFSNRLNPVDTPLIDKFKALGYNWFLGASPSFILTNLMQPYHLTLPILGARYGFVKTAKEMGRSAKKAMALVSQGAQQGWTEGKTLGGLRGALEGATNLAVHGSAALNAGEQRMVAALMASGQLDLGLARELTTLASDAAHSQQVAMRLLATGSHYSEVVNRLTAALTAYNLETARGGSEERATAGAIHAVRDTQFNYSDYNTAPWFGRHGFAGKVTPLLTSFQNFSFQVSEMIFRLAYDSIKNESAEEKAIARKALGGVLATTSMLAGTLGLPMASIVARLYDALAGSDDDPSDIKMAYRKWLAEVFGKDVAEAIARGVPRAVLGWDMSNRSGLADVVPGTRFFTDRRALKDKMESGAFDMMGPAVSAGQDFLTGMGKMYDGNVMDGLLQMTPLAIRGPLKATNMVNKGYTTANGIPLPMEVTPWAVTVQAAGFTPSVKAEQSEVNFAFQQREGLLQRRKTALTNQVARAIEQGDDPTTALAEAMAFSQANPEHHIDIAAAMTARAKQRAVAEVSGTGIATASRYLPSLDQYSFAVTK